MTYSDDRRYMTFEMRAADDPRYRNMKPCIADIRRDYYAACERMAEARKARDVEAFQRWSAKARELLSKLP